MRFWFLLLIAVLFVVAGCADHPPQDHIAQFWRPISEPNLEMGSDKAQKKLDFDVSQCHCGIYPGNVTHADIVQFSPDQQRLAQTSAAVKGDDQGQCLVQPSLVVTECMRQRGWEPTNCSGRMPLPGTGSLCASYVLPGADQ